MARLGVAAVACVLAGCSVASATPSTTGHPAASSSRTSTGLVVANGHGWTSAGLDGPIPAAGTCRLRYTASGEPLPDPACTPGAIDPTVTQTNLGTTVCRKGGYTSSVRPPEAITEPAKKQVMAAYGIPWSKASSYELDHLVELVDADINSEEFDDVMVNSGGDSDRFADVTHGWFPVVVLAVLLAGCSGPAPSPSATPTTVASTPTTTPSPA